MAARYTKWEEVFSQNENVFFCSFLGTVFFFFFFRLAVVTRRPVWLTRQAELCL